MGFISRLSNSKQPLLPGARAGRNQWNETFGATSKEDQNRFPRVRPGGDPSRSMVAEPAAFKRLLQAMRSMAPGGWSDDRWEQTKHFTDIRYICFPPGTRVRMADGTNKPIEQVALLNEVLTAEGNIHKVTHCFVRDYEGDLVVLRLWGHRHLRMTPNHQVLTKRGYVPAAELTGEDWVAIPRYIPQGSAVLQTADHIAGETSAAKSFYHKRAGATFRSTGGTPWANVRSVPDFIELNADFGRIVGLYLAEAHTEQSGIIAWSFDARKEKDTLVAELVSLLEKFGFSPRVCQPNSSVMQVLICGKLWVRLFHSLCGKGAAGKKLHQDLLAGPNEFLQGVLSGWMDGDGCVERGRYLIGSTVSHDLALNMFDIANFLGLRPTLLRQKPSQKPIMKQKMGRHLPVWKVFLRANSDNYRVQMDDMHVWRKVRAVDAEPYSGQVFNIEVEQDQSYVAEGIGVHNCIHRTGEQLMEAEFQVFEKDDRHPDGKVPVRKGHPGYALVKLLERPNHDDTFGDMMYSINQQMDLTGQHLNWMVPNALGVPMELYTVPTAVAIPQPAINPDYPDGYYRIQPVYPYGPFSSYPTPSTAVGAPIPAQWMIKTKYIHPLLRYDGYSPQTGLRLHLDEIEQMDRSRWYTMKRIINPSAVLNFDEMEGAQPLPEAEIDRIKAEFENELQGPEASGRLYVATPGAKLEPWQSELRDLQYTEGWDQLVSFAMAGLGISKEAAGMVGSTAYAVLYAAIKQLHLLTLVPKCHRIAAKLTRHLAPFFGDDLIIEIRPGRIDDHEVAVSKVTTAVTARCITKNEVRKELGMPLTEESWGNDIAGEAEQVLNPDGTPAGKVSGVRDAESGSETEEDGEKEGRTTRVSSEVNGTPLTNGRARPKASTEPSEIARDRPRPGKLGLGALGSRKALLEAMESKSFYDRMREVIRNGHDH